MHNPAETQAEAGLTGRIIMRKFIAGAALVMCAINAAHASCYIANYTNGIPNEVCTPGSSAPAAVDKWAALAVSDSTLRSATSHGQNSQAEAEQLALSLCGSVASDCKIQGWARNWCVALAVSKSDVIWGSDSAPTRAQAQAKAMTACRTYKGQNCVIQAASCASDDPRFPSPSN
jgi:hypothetical protein